MKIEYESIVLRDMTLADIDSVWTGANDPVILENTILPEPYTVNDAENWIRYNLKCTQELLPKEINRVLEYKGAIIGAIGVQFSEDKAELGYWLVKDYRGATIMKNIMPRFIESISDRGIHELVAHVFKKNLTSIALLESLGFELVPGFVEPHIKNGKHIPQFLYKKEINAHRKM